MNKTISLIGTETSGLAYLGLLLERAGFKTIKIVNSDHVGKELTTLPVDVIIIDDQLPKLNASELSQTLRKKPSISQIPIIILTAREDAAALLNHSLDSVLTKPILPHLLINRVNETLDL